MGAIQIRRRVAGPIAPLPTPTIEGELSFSVPGFTGGGPNALWMDTGTAVVPLIDRTRQVELAGAQTIAGVKTISGAGIIAFDGVANLTLADGTAGQVLTKGAGNALTWADVAAGGVTSFNTRTGAVTMVAADVTGVGGMLLAGGTMTGPLLLAADPAAPTEAATKQYVDDQIATSPVATDGVTIGGNGLMATPLALLPAIFGDGLTWTPNTVTLAQATQTAAGGGMIATAALIATGTNDASLVSPLGLRSQLGDAGTALLTNAKTVIPALNEIYNNLAQLSGVVIFAGTYDASTGTATFNGQGGIAAGTGPLPAPAAANGGAYLIATVAGAGGGVNEPAGPIGVEDWIMSDATSWNLMSFAQASIVAPNVALSPTIGAMGANVQTALEWVETGMLKLAGGTLTGPIVLDPAASILGLDGTSGGPLNIMAGASSGALPGGDVSIKGGASSTLGGGVEISGGTSTGVGAGGDVRLSGGLGAAGNSNGYVQIIGANGTAGASIGGGNVAIRGGGGLDTGRGGQVLIEGGGTGATASTTEGWVDIKGGRTDSPNMNTAGGVRITGGVGGSGALLAAGGNVEINGGSSAGSGRGGDVALAVGISTGAGPAGSIFFRGLPTTAFDIVADPTKTDAIWNNAGVLNIGAGGAGGAFLPLAGGTVTGPMTMGAGSSIITADVAVGTPLDLDIAGGNTPDLTGFGGAVNITGGSGNWGGLVTIKGGASNTAYGSGVHIEGGPGLLFGGPADLYGGPGSGPNGSGGPVQIRSGAGVGTGVAGDVFITAAKSDTGLPGNIELNFYTNDAGIGGNLIIDALPTVAPTNAKAIWNNAGVLNIGAGATYVDAANDAAAATAGVALNGIYHTGGAMRIRIV